MSVPVIDFSGYAEDDPASLRLLADRVDSALLSYGFIAVTGVGITTALREREKLGNFGGPDFFTRAFTLL